MNLSSQEIAQINQQIPGFASMTPAQQEAIVTRLRVRTAANQTSQQQNPVSSVLPTVATIGANEAMKAPAGFSSSGSLSLGGPVPAPGAPATPPTPMMGGDFSLPGVIAGAHTGVQQGEGIKKVLEGKKRTPQEHASTFFLDGGISSAAEKLGLGKIMGGKGKDQQNRDKDRGTLKEVGILDDKYDLTLSDGSKVNLGLDGSVKNYNVDFNEKGIGDIVALVNPFAYLVSGGDAKRASDLNGQITNAIKNSKDPRTEVLNLFNKAQITKEDALAGIDKLGVDDQTKNIFKNTLNGLGLQSAQGQGQTLSGTMPSLSMPYNFTLKMPAAPKPEDPRKGMRTSILQNLLGQVTQPIEPVVQNPSYKRSDTLNNFRKVAGI